MSQQANLTDLEQVAENTKWDVTGISKMRRKNGNVIELNPGEILYHEGTPTGRSRRVGFLINKNEDQNQENENNKQSS